ncbi:hypothetical protein HYH03_006774 [Edaphochlamys debaryana]|uniref:Uncharacterized protein n=1 Tax=Edaphochlamys debaryana TaxID=47281 RepID=A0A835Y264_9CHLO|nr:hypothetical protein HYH03_006774 [Edaphochlamys debaryana]|eukprot:KAG2495167.1 hypothetical protein HYH03_006774 [Edaphochlamys debaryana]
MPDDWTPFVVPFTWYQTKKFCWRCPHAVQVSCVVDGERSRAPLLAGVMHRDRELGFIAQLNHMARARPFLGMHLVDVGRSSPATPSRLTFYLTKGPCPCTKTPPPPPAAPQAAAAAAAGPLAAAAASALAAAAEPSAGPDGGGGSDSGDSSSSDTSDDEDSDGDGDGAAALAGDGEGRGGGGGGRYQPQRPAPGWGDIPDTGMSPGSRKGRALPPQMVARVPEFGPPAPHARHCRCPCHAGWLTQVLVSAAEVEERQAKKQRGAYRKQTAADGEAGGGRSGGGGGGLVRRPPLPRMTPSPLEPAHPPSRPGGPSRPPPAPSARPTSGPQAKAASGQGAGRMRSGLGSNAAEATAAALKLYGPTQPISLPSKLSQIPGYEEIMGSECTTPARVERSNIPWSLVTNKLGDATTIRVAVEVNGILIPGQIPSDAKIYSYSTGRGGVCCRLMPTPALAVGKLCKGWGLLPGLLLVMRVVTAGPGAAPSKPPAKRPRAPQPAAWQGSGEDDEEEEETSGEEESGSEESEGSEEEEEEARPRKGRLGGEGLARRALSPGPAGRVRGRGATGKGPGGGSSAATAAAARIAAKAAARQRESAAAGRGHGRGSEDSRGASGGRTRSLGAGSSGGG